MQLRTLPWREPLLLAELLLESSKYDAVFFHSGMQTDISGRYSMLALEPKKTISGSDIYKLGNKLSNNKSAFESAWFGYLGYGLKNQLESLPTDMPSSFSLPDFWFAQFSFLLLWDNHKKTLTYFGETELPYVMDEQIERSKSIIKVKQLASNMSKAEYLQKVSIVQESIIRGDISQANLTRKFFGEFDHPIAPFSLFENLCGISPAPYSAYLRIDGHHIISSSPERLLKIDAEGNAHSSPIKGTLSSDSDVDILKNSEKNRAENLMIVDLMRNDFARGAISGTVEVPELFSVSTYATLHHMHSTINAKKRADVSTLQFALNCFPAGSMTGTPKIKAIEICSDLEQQARGIYAGAIGWFGGDGSCDLSVVIRTIITNGKSFEFQVGGAIVNDSTPQAEWEETLVKARAIAKALGISESQLEAL